MKYFAVCALAWSTALAAAPAPVDGIRYTVKPGDTLSEIAARYLVNYQLYKPIQGQIRLATPEHLKPGTVIILPRDLLKSVPADAKLVAFRGAVAVNEVAPVIGMTISQGARIATANNAFATFLLSNGSKITLPSQSSVTLTRLRKIILDGSLDYQIELENGRAETKATHFTDPNSRFQFKTPLATSAVRGTEFRVAYAKSGESDSLTEVLEGGVAVGAPSATGSVIPAHFGAAVSSTGATRTEELLPAPRVNNIDDLQKDDLVHFALSPVKGAAGYHIQLAHDAGFVDVFADVKSTASVADFADVPNGNQFVRATALAPSGFEGLTEVASFKRKLNSIRAIVEQGGHGGFRFKWVGNGGGVTQYRFQLTRNIGDVPLVDEPAMTAQEIELTDLAPGVYFWRVAAAQYDEGDVSVSWTDFTKLTIAGAKRN